MSHALGYTSPLQLPLVAASFPASPTSQFVQARRRKEGGVIEGGSCTIHLTLRLDNTSIKIDLIPGRPETEDLHP